MAVIPKEMSPSESGVYQNLIRVAQQRKLSGQGPRPIVVITDLGKDYDDLAALTVLKEFHRLGLIELRAVVANLNPADKRARFARAALDSLGLRGIPVAHGTRGSPEDHEELAHEFSEFSLSREVPKQDGQALLLEVYENAKEKGEKLHLLCLSSLQDIDEFAQKHSQLVRECTAEVHMQGGNYISSEGKLEPDSKAANNRFNWEAAAGLHSFIQANALPSHTYTKIAAFAAPLTSDVFVELEATGHPIGAYMRRVQVEQDLAFYKRACESDPEKRFAPFMDQNWFLANKTDWHQRAQAEEDHALPTGKEVIPYLTKIVLYDVHAALGVAGQDVVAALNMFQSNKRSMDVMMKSQGKVVKVQHWITGDDQSTVVPKALALAVSSLLKGSLLAAVHLELDLVTVSISKELMDMSNQVSMRANC